MRRILFRLNLLLVVFVLSSQAVSAQSPCLLLNVNEDQELNCIGECVTLEAEFSIPPEVTTSSYLVTQSPETCNLPQVFVGDPANVEVDDTWSDVIDLPFDFDFFGNNFSQIVISGNGLVSFDTSLATNFSGWNINDDNLLPTNGANAGSFPGNTIFGAFHDMDPSIPLDDNPDDLRISFSMVGEAPARIFVINFDHVPHFGFACEGDFETTQQIALFETSNIIAINLINKPSCDDWNDGLATVGVQNADTTEAFFPPERNTGVWEANDEIWYFIPNGEFTSGTDDPLYDFSWQDTDGNILSTETSFEVCPTETTTYRGVISAETENGVVAILESDVTITVNYTTGDAVEVSACNIGDDTGNFDLTLATADIQTNYPGSTVVDYFTSTDNAINNNEAITNATNYNSAVGTVYATVEQADGCVIMVPINLVLTVFEASDASLLACDDTGSNMAVFDLTEADADILAGITGTIEGYFESMADAENNMDAITNPTSYSSGAGTVFVLVENDTNCTDIVEITLTVSTITITLPTDIPLCPGVPVTLDAGAGFASYEWSTNETTQSITVDTVGTYTVTVTNADGCSTSGTIDVIPGLTPTITDVDVNGSTVIIIAEGGVQPYEYSIDNGGNFQASNTFLNVTNGTYEAVVVGDNGCLSDPQAFAVIVIPTLFTPNGDGINDVWNVEGMQIYSSVSVEAYDRYGRLVYNREISNQSQLWDGLDNNGKKLPSGDYFYKIIVNDNQDEFQGNITIKNRKRK